MFSFQIIDAYKQADGRKIDNRRVLVDVERGRTVPNWRPRRLGGGLGSSRIAIEEAPRYLSSYIYFYWLIDAWSLLAMLM